MIIERTTKEIIFRLPYSTNVDDLQDLTDLLEYKEIVNKSKASHKDVDNLTNELSERQLKKSRI